MSSGVDKLRKIMFGRDEVAEVIKGEELESIPRFEEHASLWGIVPLPPLHFHYDRLIIKQWDLIEAGFKHHVLIADEHAKLEDSSLSWEDVSLRSAYYEFYLRNIAKLSNASIVRGSTFQKTDQYIELLYTAGSHITLNGIKAAVPDYISSTDFRVGNIFHAAMQMVDHLGIGKGIDTIFASKGQRRTYVACRELMQKIGKTEPILIFSNLTHDLDGKPLSESQTSTRLSIHDKPEKLASKIAKMFAPPHSTEGNPLVELFIYSVLPWFAGVEVKTQHKGTVMLGPDERDEFIQLYTIGEIHPKDLKDTVTRYLTERTHETEAAFSSKPELLNWIDKSRFA